MKYIFGAILIGLVNKKMIIELVFLVGWIILIWCGYLFVRKIWSKHKGIEMESPKFPIRALIGYPIAIYFGILTVFCIGVSLYGGWVLGVPGAIICLFVACIGIGIANPKLIEAERLKEEQKRRDRVREEIQ